MAGSDILSRKRRLRQKSAISVAAFTNDHAQGCYLPWVFPRWGLARCPLRHCHGRDTMEICQRSQVPCAGRNTTRLAQRR